MWRSAETTTRAFKEAWVTDLIERPKLVPPRIDNIFLSIDPSGGGASAFGIATLGRLSNGDVLVHLIDAR